jgi:hypothetical protein
LPRLCGAFFLSHGQLIELPATWLCCADGRRSLARRIWRAHVAIPASLGRCAAQLVDETPSSPGRVHDLGGFDDETVRQALAACLPDVLAAALRPRLQWYACRGAGFHTDAHYSSVLFGAWCLAGPQRDIVFADPALQLACPPGELVVFDPFQAHAVLDPGQGRYQRERYVAADATVFLGFDVELTAAVRQRFGIGPPEPGAFSISSSTAVNAETGEMARPAGI